MGRNAEVTLSIVGGEWDAEAACLLSPAIDDAADLAAIANQVEHGEASLFRIFRSGELIGAYVLRVDYAPGGDEGVIVAGAGSMPDGSLLGSVVPYIETQFSNVRRVRFHTRKPAMLRALAPQGYTGLEFVAIKNMEGVSNGRRPQ
jgi:hypothetical protein